MVVLSDKINPAPKDNTCGNGNVELNDVYGNCADTVVGTEKLAYPLFTFISTCERYEIPNLIFSVGLMCKPTLKPTPLPSPFNSAEASLPSWPVKGKALRICTLPIAYTKPAPSETTSLKR